MKFLLVAQKTLLEQVRDPVGLGLTLLTTPALVLFFWYVVHDGAAGRPPAAAAGGMDPCAAVPPFDRGVAPLLAFSAILLVFSSAMAIAREVESGTLLRLRMTTLRPVELLGGVSLAQGLVGAATIAVSFFVAMALGLRSRGPLVGCVAAVALAALGCVGIGMVVASRARTVHRAFLLASGVMLVLMLFSGVVFPLPHLVLVRAGTVTLELFDVLPTRHAVAALGACMLEGAGLGALAPRLAAAAATSAAYFALGVALFTSAVRGAR